MWREVWHTPSAPAICPFHSARRRGGRATPLLAACHWRSPRSSTALYRNPTYRSAIHRGSVTSRGAHDAIEPQNARYASYRPDRPVHWIGTSALAFPRVRPPAPRASSRPSTPASPQPAPYAPRARFGAKRWVTARTAEARFPRSDGICAGHSDSCATFATQGPGIGTTLTEASAIAGSRAPCMTSLGAVGRVLCAGGAAISRRPRHRISALCVGEGRFICSWSGVDRGRQAPVDLHASRSLTVPPVRSKAPE